jgi:hypothetical protein
MLVGVLLDETQPRVPAPVDIDICGRSGYLLVFGPLGWIGEAAG